MSSMRVDKFIIKVGESDSWFILQDKTVIQLVEWDNNTQDGVSIVGDLFE